MKQILTVLILLISFTHAHPQNQNIDTTKVYNFVEISAEFRGGFTALSDFIDQNLKYPAKARELEIEGTVTVKFIIERDGRITNVELLRGIDKELDEEAVRLVSSMPKWRPGKIGRAVRQSYVLPISFRLPR